ncbi:hypothetical protein C3V36_03435 [Lachnospiraceae bacterium oral taxon 500]|nr:hypothetical protein C3V36_03435 [Lachnospiraceae bacterium oral taxon 500]
MKTKRQKSYENSRNWVLRQQCRWLVWQQQSLGRIRQVLGNNKGMGIVEIALIIVVIVALAFAFKVQIFRLLDSIFNGIDIKELGAQPKP